MKRARQTAFQKIEGLLHPDAVVILLGALSRTWYQDQGRIVELLLLLGEYGVRPVLIGDGPFRLTAIAAEAVVSDVAGFFCLLDNEDTEALLTLQRAELCFAFPSRMSKDIRAANPLMEALLRQKTPTVAIAPDGRTSFAVLEEQ